MTILPIGKASTAPLSPLNEPARAYAPPSQTALGGRDAEALASYDFTRLLLACQNPNVVPNGSKSTGCSPVLRELLRQSGAVYQVTREVFDDGDSAGHQGGNAIDVSSPYPIAVAALFRTAPTLVDTFAYLSPYGSESLFIRDGMITTSSDVAGLVDSSGATVHLSSSLHRLNVSLSKPAVQSAIAAATSGQFTNRDVYAQDPTGSVGLTSEATRNAVHFW